MGTRDYRRKVNEYVRVLNKLFEIRCKCCDKVVKFKTEGRPRFDGSYAVRVKCDRITCMGYKTLRFLALPARAILPSALGQKKYDAEQRAMEMLVVDSRAIMGSDGWDDQKNGVLSPIIVDGDGKFRCSLCTADLTCYEMLQE